MSNVIAKGISSKLSDSEKQTIRDNLGLGSNIVTKTDNQALHDTDALRISGSTLYLYKGDGGNESVDLVERGVFVPGLRGDVVAGNPTFAVEPPGWYTRIGSMVTVSVRFRITNKGGMDGQLEVFNLPFSSWGGYHSGTIGYFSGGPATSSEAYIVPDQTYLKLVQSNPFGTLGANDIQDNTQIMITISYITSD